MLMNESDFNNIKEKDVSQVNRLIYQQNNKQYEIEVRTRTSVEEDIATIHVGSRHSRKVVAVFIAENN